MAFNVTVTPIVQEVEVNASVTPYEVDISVIDGQDLTLTTVGTSGVATYNPFTGLLNIPNYSTDLSGVVPISRTLTINGVAFDLSANRTWTIPTHDAVTIGTANGLSLAGQVLSLGLASAGVTGALSGTDWTTFNNKQNALTNPVTGTATSGQVAFWNGTTSQTGDASFTWDNTNKRFQLRDSTGTNTHSIFSSGGRLVISRPNSTAESITIGDGNAELFIRGGLGRIIHSASVFTIQNTATNGDINITLNGTGRVGVQTGAPTAILDVNGTGRIRNGVSLADTSGNVQIGTTTDAGFRLDVNGTARVQGALTGTGSVASANYNAISIINTGGGSNSSVGITLTPSTNVTTEIRSQREGANSNGNLIFITTVFPTTSEKMRLTAIGNLLIGTTTDVASSKLTIESTTQGFLPPRMTTAQRDLIATPATGLVIYNTSTNTHQGYNGTTWNNFY